MHGVRRDVSRLPEVFTAHAADYSEPGSLDFAAALQPDIVVATFNPFDRSEVGYRRGFAGGMQNLLRGLGAHLPAHVFMASSTRVYAEQDGGWVDEHSALSTQDNWALSIIAAERDLLDSALSATVLRFGGIYGIPGGRLLARISRGEISPRLPLRYTNRIHREDCAGLLVHLITQALGGENLEPVYTAVDDYPAPRYEVESWLARQLGVELPEEDVHEPVRHNAGGHKRCKNLALQASGYKLLYPDYKAGYSKLLAQD